MYDVSNEASLTSALEYWIPGVESFSDAPMILVGGKADLYRQTQDVEDIMQDVS